MLERSLEDGIASMGGTPYSVGVLPTPGIAHLTKEIHADAGIVISASHNPYDDNGIKVFTGNGFKLSDEQETSIEDLILNGKLGGRVSSAREMGRGERVKDAIERYGGFLRSTFPTDLSMKGLKIVIDTANGATFEVAPRVFRELGADCEVIHDTPDGFNINDNCGSQYTQDLEKRVKDSNTAIGLAFDGDGDRLIAVDEAGRSLTGDQILIICAKGLKDQGLLKNDVLVSTVMSNLGLTVACRKNGIKHHTTNVGDRHVLEKMLRVDAVLGGEDSGHMIFLDHHTTGDGVLAAIQLISTMIREQKSLSELSKLMDVYPQVLINVEVTRKPDITTVPQVAEAIKKAEVQLGDQGRVLVRYSGTQNMCRVMVEGPTHRMTEACCKHIAEIVAVTLG
jgi:phosphoglucosamine mutase